MLSVTYKLFLLSVAMLPIMASFSGLLLRLYLIQQFNKLVRSLINYIILQEQSEQWECIQVKVSKRAFKIFTTNRQIDR
jgi:hypothetical protein